VTITDEQFRREVQFRYGERHGKAVATKTNGVIWEYNYVGDKCQGPAKITWPDGTYLLCEYINGKRMSTGVKNYADGGKYQGQLNEKTQPHGEGIWEFPDGRRYEGQVKEGYLCGIGVMTFPDGTRQEGRFEKDEYIGPAEPVSEEGGV
jgi:hypothetical protein